MNIHNKYPFLIGITGHRDIAACDIPVLRTYIDGQFKAIKSACEGTPVVVMTCLAEGADQLCAEIALANDIPIISVLPFEKNRLERDFVGDALTKFNDFYNQSAKILVAPDMEGEARTEKDYWYRQSGIYIAERCQLILALWDGSKDTTGCGTAAIINYATQEWSNNDIGFAYNPKIEWIHTRRAKDIAENEKFTISTENIGVNTDDVASFARKYAGKVRELNKCSSGTIDAANKLAIDYRNRHTNSNRIIVGGGVITVLFFMLYNVFDNRIALVITLLAFLIVVIRKYLAGAKKGDYFRKYVSYRILAETNRVQEFTTALNKSYSVCNFYTFFLKETYEWVELASRAHLACEDEEKFIDETAVRDNWCKGQHIYHKNVVTRDLPKLQKQKLGTRIAFIITITVYAALVLMEFTIGHAIVMVKTFKVLMAVGSAISLFASDYYAKQALEHKCQDSDKMTKLYRKAYDEWVLRNKKKQSNDELVKMLARTEIEEIGIWASYQR